MNYDSLIHYLRYGWLIQNEIQSQIHLQWILNSVLVVIQSRYIRNTYRQNTYRNTTWIRMFERTYFNTCFNTYLNTPPDTLGHDVFQYMFQYTFKYTCGYTWPCITLYWPVNVSNIVLDIWYKHVSTLHFAVHTMYHHRIIPIHHCIPSIWLIQLECSFEYISNTKLNTHQTDLFDTSGTLFNTFWNTNAKHLLNTWISTPKIFVSVHVFRLSIIVANTRIRLIHVLNRYTLDTRLIQRNTWFWILHKKRPLTAWETPFHGGMRRR